MLMEPEIWLRLAAAVAAGGLIGLEREYRDKAAGFRTLIFISLGAALFTLISVELAGGGDPARIASNIVTGVGFIGAGVILREGGHIAGLTTAATIWLTAALGTALGAGYYALGMAVLLIAMLVLWVFPHFEHWVDGLREARTYEVICGLGVGKEQKIEELFARHGLRVAERHLSKVGDKMCVRLQTVGRPGEQEALMKELMADPEIVSVQF